LKDKFIIAKIRKGERGKQEIPGKNGMPQANNFIHADEPIRKPPSHQGITVRCAG
jgi:hypothetical protein